MKKLNKSLSCVASVVIAALGGFLVCPSISLAQKLNLRILETTDIHANVMDFDYYKNKATEKFGLTRTASLIKNLRSEVANSVLIDNGDLTQGSPMGDYMSSKGIRAGEVHPVYKAMNLLDYEVGTLGNHEFNFGLDFLNETINDAAFPYINANVMDAKTGKNMFKPYLIKEYKFKDQDEKMQPIKIGYIGFVPPQIMVWDKKNLENKVIVKDIIETAKLLIPQMKSQGADVIIAIAHSGISSEPYKVGAENAGYYLSQIKGIDAIALGHSHSVFPGKEFTDIKGVDTNLGTINGIASVMPGRWGSHVGVMDLTLEKGDKGWSVIKGTGEARPIYDKKGKKALVVPDLQILNAVKADHNATKKFVDQVIGKSNAPMYSYLALVQDDPTVQIVNLAQKDYVEKFIQADPSLKDIPVLSAAAPFKVGGRKNDPTNFTEVGSGELSFKNAADLYLYPNTLVALKVTGQEVKDWLECSAGQFNQIDLNSTAPQELINWSGFRTYNFDVLDGVQYQIDVTQAAKYDGNCKVINKDAQRISKLTFKGKPIDLKQSFLIATNNYRAYSGKFAGTGSEFVAFAAPDQNRAVVANYITRVSKEEGMIKPSADNNWSFAPIVTQVKLDLRFESASNKKASDFIKANGQYPMKRLGVDDIGFAIYQIDLTK